MLKLWCYVYGNWIFNLVSYRWELISGRQQTNYSHKSYYFVFKIAQKWKTIYLLTALSGLLAALSCFSIWIYWIWHLGNVDTKSMISPFFSLFLIYLPKIIHFLLLLSSFAEIELWFLAWYWFLSLKFVTMDQFFLIPYISFVVWIVKCTEGVCENIC